jgi:hypothetical protein
MVPIDYSKVSFKKKMMLIAVLTTVRAKCLSAKCFWQKDLEAIFYPKDEQQKSMCLINQMTVSQVVFDHKSFV